MERLERKTTVSLVPDLKQHTSDWWSGGLPRRYKSLLQIPILEVEVWYNLFCFRDLWKKGNPKATTQTGIPKHAESQDDPTLQLLAACSYSLAKAQEAMDSAGLILTPAEAAVACLKCRSYSFLLVGAQGKKNIENHNLWMDGSRGFPRPGQNGNPKVLHGNSII